jgi:adenylylsulfate kinase
MMQKMKSSNTVWHNATVTRRRREELNGHKSVILWFTGLSGSGKSTLAHAVEENLYQKGCRTIVLDGDNVRHGLCNDLGFSDEDRKENIRRIAELSKITIESGVIALTAFISPFQSDRDEARSLVDKGDLIEVFCECPLHVCEKRDVKGLYRRARKGEIKEFTGISSPYEAPSNADIRINTSDLSLEESVDRIVDLLQARGIIKGGDSLEST